MRLSKLMQITLSLPSFFILLGHSPFVAANHSFAHTYEQAFSVGMTYELSGENLSVYIDENKLLKNIPKLKAQGLVGTYLTPTQASFYQSLLAASISIHYMIDIIKNMYSTHPQLDQLHASAYLFSADLYGNKEKNLCYSFDFNRKLYQKINWRNFNPDNIKQIAPHFKTADVCNNLIETNPMDI